MASHFKILVKKQTQWPNDNSNDHCNANDSGNGKGNRNRNDNDNDNNYNNVNYNNSGNGSDDGNSNLVPRAFSLAWGWGLTPKLGKRPWERGCGNSNGSSDGNDNGNGNNNYNGTFFKVHKDLPISVAKKAKIVHSSYSHS